MQIFYCNDTKEINVTYRNGLPFVSKGSLPKGAVVVGSTALLPAKDEDNFLRGKNETRTVSYAVELKEKKASWYIPVGNHKYIAVTGKLPKDTATAAVKESIKKEPVVKEKEVKAKAEKPIKERKEKKEKEKSVKENAVSGKEQNRKKRKGAKPWLIAGIVCLSVLLVAGGGLFIIKKAEINPGDMINRLRENNKLETTSQNSTPVEKIEDSEQMEQLIEQSETEDVSLKELGIRLPSSISLQDGELVVENEKEGRYLSYNFYQEDVMLATSDMLPAGSSYTFSLSDVKEGKLKIVIDVYDEATFDLMGSGEKEIKIKK